MNFESNAGTQTSSEEEDRGIPPREEDAPKCGVQGHETTGTRRLELSALYPTLRSRLAVPVSLGKVVALRRNSTHRQQFGHGVLSSGIARTCWTTATEPARAPHASRVRPHFPSSKEARPTENRQTHQLN